MKSYFYHLQININYSHVEFYKKLMAFLGGLAIFEQKYVIGFKSESNGDLWFTKSLKVRLNDYDNIGVNHISIRVENQKDIVETAAFLKKQKTNCLFKTPRHRPEFSSSNNETYYQVMFESPDKILFEVVYIGPKKKI